MLINILVGFTKMEASMVSELEYVRILGMSKKGVSYYKSIKKDFKINTSVKLERTLTSSIEVRASYIYSILTNTDYTDEKKKHVILN